MNAASIIKNRGFRRAREGVSVLMAEAVERLTGRRFIYKLFVPLVERLRA